MLMNLPTLTLTTTAFKRLVQFVEAPRYKPEDLGFDSRWCYCNFSLAQSFRPHYGPGVDSPYNRNEYQEYFLRVKAAGA